MMRTAPDHHSRGIGFTLIEMLIAVFFIGILMAGMLRMYAASIAGFASSRERIAAQRSSRWALGFLEDDLQSAGFFFPLRPIPGYISVAAGRQNPVMVLPNQALTLQTRQPDGAIANETLTVDELQVLMDLPLDVSAQLAAPPISPGVLNLTVNSGSLSEVRPGDYALLLDSNYEKVLVSAVTGNTVLLDTATAAQDPVTGQATGISAGLKNLNHQAGAQMMFVRPNVVIRHSIQGDHMDPADPAAQVPVLVREMASYPTTGALLDWASFGASTPGYTRQVVVANASGLRIDMSADGGKTWVRTGASASGVNGWSQCVAALNAQLAGNPVPTNSITNASNPLWYRNVPVLFRLDLQTRGSNLRSEFSPAGSTLAFATRTQTLFVSPRNFTFGN